MTIYGSGLLWAFRFWDHSLGHSQCRFLCLACYILPSSMFTGILRSRHIFLCFVLAFPGIVLYLDLAVRPTLSSQLFSISPSHGPRQGPPPSTSEDPGPRRYCCLYVSRHSIASLLDLVCVQIPSRIYSFTMVAPPL